MRRFLFLTAPVYPLQTSPQKHSLHHKVFGYYTVSRKLSFLHRFCFSYSSLILWFSSIPHIFSETYPFCPETILLRRFSFFPTVDCLSTVNVSTVHSMNWESYCNLTVLTTCLLSTAPSHCIPCPYLSDSYLVFAKFLAPILYYRPLSLCLFVSLSRCPWTLCLIPLYKLLDPFCFILSRPVLVNCSFSYWYFGGWPIGWFDMPHSFSGKFWPDRGSVLTSPASLLAVSLSCFHCCPFMFCVCGYGWNTALFLVPLFPLTLLLSYIPFSLS